MSEFQFSHHLRTYLEIGEMLPNWGKAEKWKLTRSASNFLLKDSRLFYIGPSQRYMRLVIMSEEERNTVLSECHIQQGTGNHSGVRGTRDRVVARYYWHTITRDVTNWVRCCQACQLNEPVKTVAPVIRPSRVKANWSVVWMDLIGPLKETARKKQYILTMIDLRSKFVVAEPLQSKSAVEVSAAITAKFYVFGMVSEVLSDHGSEFVDELNKEIFALLNIKDAVSTDPHPYTNDQDKRTYRKVKRALRRYISEHHDNWDIHLQAMVYGINTAKQSSMKTTPFNLFFHRRHLLPEVLKACPQDDQLEARQPEGDLEVRMTNITTDLDEEVVSIEIELE